MSMDLFLWKAPVTNDPDEAAVLLRRYFEDGDKMVFEASEDVSRVLEIIRQNYPDDPESGAEDSSPWASWPIPDSDRLIELNIRWSSETRLPADVVVLARKYDLVLYDPQGPDVFLSTDPVEDLTPPRRTTAWEWMKIFLIAAGLLALTYAAWLIPIGWLRWPAVIVAGFFDAAAVFVLGLMIASALGVIDPEKRDCFLTSFLARTASSAYRRALSRSLEKPMARPKGMPWRLDNVASLVAQRRRNAQA